MCPSCGLDPTSPHIPHILPQWPGLHGTPRRAPVVVAQFTNPSLELGREMTRGGGQGRLRSGYSCHEGGGCMLEGEGCIPLLCTSTHFHTLPHMCCRFSEEHANGHLACSRPA
eukprot:353338-Chlamydomonas_euryale.AAC.7